MRTKQAENALLSLAAGSLDDEQEKRLAAIYKHFRQTPWRKRKPKQKKDKASGAGGSGDTSSEKPDVTHDSLQDPTSSSMGADKPLESLSTRWSALLSLAQVEEPQFVKAHLARFPWPKGTPDAIAFLNERPCEVEDYRDRLNTPFPQKSTNIRSHIFSKNSQVDAAMHTAVLQNLTRRVNHTADTLLKSQIQQAIHNYLLLMWYDFTKALWPHKSGSRLGTQMEKDLLPILNVMLEGEQRLQGLIETWCKQIVKWSQQGRKLHEVLCEPLGEASLLVLNEHLTPVL